MGIEGSYLNIIKAIYDKLTANILLNGEKLESISSKIRKKTRISTLATFIQRSLGSPSHINQRRKRNKRNPNWKRSKSVTVWVLYIENPKDATRKLLELINEFGKVAGYKINTEKYLAFLYTDNRTSEREIKETILFTAASKRIKYLRINLPNEAKDLYSENCKILMKEITNRWKDTPLLSK